MSAALRDYYLLWRAALATRHPRAGAMVCGMALFGALFVGFLAWLKTADPLEVAINGARAAFAVLALGSLAYFVPGALKLNTPANARLVPRMRRRAMQLTVLVWMCVTGLGTLLAPGSMLGMAAVFLGLGSWIIALALNRSGHWAGTPLLFLHPMAIMLIKAVPHAWLALLASGPGLAVASLLMLAFGAFTLDTMFPEAGDRHFRLRAAQQLASEKATVEGQARQVRVSRLGGWMYDAALRRDCAHRDAGVLLQHLLGPAVHWSQRQLPFVLFALAAAGILAVLPRFASADTLGAIANGSWVFVSSALAVQLFDYQRRMMRLDFTRAEQGLLKLAPSLPGAAADFNRRLARRLLRDGLVEWAVVSASVLGVVAVGGAPAPILLIQACMCCLTLPLVASTLRDHARRSSAGGWALVVWLLVSLAACLLAGAVVRRMFGTPVMPVAAAAAVLLAIMAVAWRWRRLCGAPHAFPVGRFA